MDFPSLAVVKSGAPQGATRQDARPDKSGSAAPMDRPTYADRGDRGDRSDRGYRGDRDRGGYEGGSSRGRGGFGDRGPRRYVHVFFSCTEGIVRC